MENNKKTQGSQKMLQYLEDLKRNKYFQEELNKYIGELKKLKLNNLEKKDIIVSLIKRYLKIGKATLKALKEYEKNDSFKITKKISEEYFLDGHLFSYILLPIITGHILDQNLFTEIDMCNFKDNYNENFSESDMMNTLTPSAMKYDYKFHCLAYPVSIDVHHFASKRDVLDYIEKNWWLIQSGLSFGIEKRKRFRKRKFERKILDFIWENKHLDIKKLKLEIDEKFPHNGLAYYELYQLKNQERKRRMLKINVGQ